MIRGAIFDLSLYALETAKKAGYITIGLFDAHDRLYADGQYTWLTGKRIDNPNTHGTGCTLSSAIAANLAKGIPLKTAVTQTKEYISGALAAMFELGRGTGPMDHGFAIRSAFTGGTPISTEKES